MNYREIYRDIKDATESFTRDSGIFKVQSKTDLEIAISILKNFYSDVKNVGLDFNDLDIDGSKYQISFDDLKNRNSDIIDDKRIGDVNMRESFGDRDLVRSTETLAPGETVNDYLDDAKKYHINITQRKGSNEVSLFGERENLRKYYKEVIGVTMDDDALETVKKGLDEEIQKHDTLNPDLWDENNELLPEVKDKLEDITDRFNDALKNDGIELDILDVVIIGSNASYNYNDASDIDLHIIADTSVYDNEDLALKIYLAYKALFNNKYDPKIRNHEVEVYVEPYEVHANSKGIYSLKNGWLKEPERVDIPEIDQKVVDDYLAPFIERYNDIIDHGTVEDVNKLIDDIYLERQRSIIKDGEFAIPNLAFKEFRANGYLQNLRDKKVELENNEMSLNDDFNSSLESMFIENEFDAINEEILPDTLKVGDIFRGHNVEIEVLALNDDDSVLYRYDGEFSRPYEGLDPIESFMNMINSFNFKRVEDEAVNEDYVELRNGIEFKFPEVRDTLKVYLQWEGIYGYTDDILEVMEEYASYDFLDSYLTDNGIFGFTQHIYDILMGKSAYCSKMDRGDFIGICNELGIDYKEAESYDGETITEDNTKEAYDINVDVIEDGDIVPVTVDTIQDGDLAYNIVDQVDGTWLEKTNDDFILDESDCKDINEDIIPEEGKENANKFLKYLKENDCETTGYFSENPVEIDQIGDCFQIRLYSQVSDMTFSFYDSGEIEVSGYRMDYDEDNNEAPIEYNEYLEDYSDFVKWYKDNEFTWTTDWGSNLTEAVDDTISDADVTFAVTKIVNDAKIDNLDPVKVLTSELRDGKLKDFDSLTVKDREYLRGHNGGWRVHDTATKKLLYSVPREAGPRGIASDIVSDLLSESVDLKEVKKRISHDNEFDNGKVFFSYYDWTEDEAQEKAKEASLKDPKDIYYVKYDDIMNPAGDFIWFRGKQYNYKDRDKLRNVNESYLDNSDEYVIDRLKNDLLYNYKIKPADIVKKGNDFLVVFFTKEDKEKVMKRPDMLSPVRIKGELGYPYRFASIDINAMRKANNPKYDRIIRGYDEYTLQKKYNDFSIHSIDDVAEDELDESLNEDIALGDVYGRDDKPWLVIYKPLGKKNIPQIGLLSDDGHAGDIRTFKDYNQVINFLKTNFLYKMPDKKFDFETNSLVESLKEGYNRLSKKFDNIEDARKFAKFLDPDLDQRIEQADHENEDGSVSNLYEVSYFDPQDFHDDELVEKIVKVNNKYQVQSKKGRNMGTYDTKKEAEDRLKEVEMFKHMNEELDEDEPDWLVKWGKDPLNRLIGDRDTGDRNIKPGINWTWFWTDNKQDAIRWFKQLTGVLPYESTLVKDDKNWGFRLDNEFVGELEEPIDDSDEWIGRTPEYWKDDYKLPEDFREDLKDINPFLADLVSKSSSTLKKYLRDPKFSEEEKKQIRTELINRGFYPRGKGPNSVSFRNSRNESSSN